MRKSLCYSYSVPIKKFRLEKKKTKIMDLWLKFNCVMLYWIILKTSCNLLFNVIHIFFVTLLQYRVFKKRNTYKCWSNSNTCWVIRITVDWIVSYRYFSLLLSNSVPSPDLHMLTNRSILNTQNNVRHNLIDLY